MRIARALSIAVSSALLTAGTPAWAGADDDEVEHEPAPRRADATWREIFGGPFQTSRLFAMPTAEVVGAFQLSLSGDASLLSETNVLSTSSVIALGFGDIAQLEYRNSVAVSTLENNPIGFPTIGVQLKLPLKRRTYWPQLAGAFRFGIPQKESDGGIDHEERATDFYVVSRLQLWGALERLTLHGALRIAATEINSDGASAPADAKRTLLLPTGGLELQVTDRTVVITEVALVPLFAPGDAATESRIRSGLFGRAGIRWRVIPSIVFDASVGYRIETNRLEARPADMASAVVDWDIRLGGEIFIPWGAAMCRTAKVFCEGTTTRTTRED